MWIKEIAAQYKSGFSGIPISQKRNKNDERRLVRWLNDEWDSHREVKRKFEKWKRDGAGWSDLADMPNDEDVPARNFIVKEFLPRFTKVRNMPDSAREAIKRGREAMKKFPGKYQNEEEAANEESGVADRARLTEMFSKHKILPLIPSKKDPPVFVVRGENMTQVWAMYLLLQMASDGVLENLKQCDCGCGIWFIKRRQIDRFFNTACRVRHHQSNEAFKEERRIAARKLYQLELRGKIIRGWKNGSKKGGKA